MIARYQGWTDDAVDAMQANPPYFAWWYTVKSVALVGAFGWAMYLWGKERRGR